jgi:fructokinase
VGDDPLADRLIEALQKEGIRTDLVLRKPEAKTSITLVEVDDNGDRRFYPFWEKSADLAIDVDDIDEERVAHAALFHHGTVSLRSPACRRATQKAVRAARRGGAIVSLDVNLRYGMFATREQLQARARSAIKTADVLKITDDEAQDLYGASTLDGWADRLHKEGVSLVMLTRGPEGALLSSRSGRVRVPSEQVKAVDATGAGDSFMGTALAELMRRKVARGDLAALDDEALAEIGRRACRSGALTVTALGATAAMPRSFT